MSFQSIIDNISELSSSDRLTALDNYMLHLSKTVVDELTPDQLLAILIECCSVVQYYRIEFLGYDELRSKVLQTYPLLVGRFMCYECF